MPNIKDTLAAEHGLTVSVKRIRRLRKPMGIQAIYPKPRTSTPGKGHKTCPYLLREVQVKRPNQVWAADVTHIPMARGFLYLVTLIDWYSRLVLSWRLSNIMDVHFCLAALEEALSRYGKPEIFNTDQGSQFTSEQFTSVLLGAGVKISMVGKGRCLDNVCVERLWRSVKREEVYLRAYVNGREARHSLGKIFAVIIPNGTIRDWDIDGQIKSITQAYSNQRRLNPMAEMHLNVLSEKRVVVQ